MSSSIDSTVEWNESSLDTEQSSKSVASFSIGSLPCLSVTCVVMDKPSALEVEGFPLNVISAVEDKEPVANKFSSVHKIKLYSR